MTDHTASPTLPNQGACPLPHLGVIRATGADAASFLHNQLTQDFLLIKPDQARLTAFCNAKGRMQASMIGFKTGAEEVLLVLRQDLLPQTLKRLSMFVLRSKVTLTDASAALAVWGCLGGADTPPWTLSQVASGWQVALYPAAGVSRSMRVVPSDLSPDMPHLDVADWLLSEVLSGIADVQAATFEAFVPQMLNYESVDGVNFKKGCYPGQEVVARSQFRGTLKRRAGLVSSTSRLQAGQEVFLASDLKAAQTVTQDVQPVGVVAQAVDHPTQGHWALVCLQTSAMDMQAHATAVGLATLDGALLTGHPLPYALKDDI